jgi:uncharacterized protein YjbI with pentapeptide repeats
VAGVKRDQRRPPRNAKELLRRYAAGERDFHDANLSGADLRIADLSGARLSGADLREADLTDANLRTANLRTANLSGAKLGGADLTDANLSGARLSRANLSRAYLIGTKLGGAHLAEAQFFQANLSFADLGRANLSGANLGGASLIDADLRGADLRGARLLRTQFAGVELAALCGADPPVRHDGPSTVDHRSILRSVRAPGLKDFLIRTGMPEVFVEYMVDCALSLQSDVFKMLQSTFVSYGAPDETFARKLYEALHRNGVTTFFFTEHAEPGEKLHRMMRKGVNEHDRVILVCSKDSLDRKGVLNELEEILAREARDGGASYLIPIRLDGYVFTGWKSPNADVAQAVRDRVVADFEGTDKDDAKFQAGLQKLIRALRKKSATP